MAAGEKKLKKASVKETLSVNTGYGRGISRRYPAPLFVRDVSLQLPPFWSCNNLQKCFAISSKKGLQKTKIASVRNAMEKLSADQLDLIFDLYGLQRVILDLGREKGVTEAAIRNRRNKILKRMKKLLDAEIR